MKSLVVVDHFTLPEGPAAFQYPESLSEESFGYLKEWVELELRKIERTVKAAPPPPLAEKERNQ